MTKRTAVFGGAGFLGTNLVYRLIEQGRLVYNFDNLSGLGNLLNIADLMQKSNHFFARCDASNPDDVRQALLLGAVDDIFVCISPRTETWKKDAEDFRAFFESLLSWRSTLGEDAKAQKIIILISSRHENNGHNLEAHQKIRALVNEYIEKGLPLLTLTAPKGFGPFQQPDSPIPLMIYRAIEGESIPVVGADKIAGELINSTSIVDALLLVEEKGVVGVDYQLSGSDPKLTNFEIADIICSVLNEKSPPPIGRYQALIDDLGDQALPEEAFPRDESALLALGMPEKKNTKEALEETVLWYLDNQKWFNQSKLRYFDLWQNPQRVLNPEVDSAH